MRTYLLGGSAALLMVLTPGLSQAAAPTGLVATFSGDYANSDSNGSNADSWGINGSGAFGFGTNDLAGEIDAGYHRLSASGVDADLWGVGGSAFWAPGMGRFGATITYNSINFSGALSGLDGHITTYGVFGEFFASEFITLGLKGGGLDGTVSLSGLGSASDTGSYVGGGVTGYIIPNLSLSGTVDYLDISGGHITSYGVGAEYLVSDSLPVSVFGGYARTNLSGGGGDADTWFIGLRFYTGAQGTTLVQHHRTGTLGAIGSISGLQYAF